MRIYFPLIITSALSFIGVITYIEFSHQRLDGFMVEIALILLISVSMMCFGFIHKQLFISGMVVFLGCVISLSISSFQELRTIDTVKRIQKALDNHYEDKGEYPEFLRELALENKDLPILTSIGITKSEFIYGRKVDDYYLRFSSSTGVFACDLEDSKRVNPCVSMGY